MLYNFGNFLVFYQSLLMCFGANFCECSLMMSICPVLSNNPKGYGTQLLNSEMSTTIEFQRQLTPGADSFL